ncbi:GtrA family protein [Microbacterium sp. SD291]|uniref:GtrA family protein n=1 Tax=Microbacterium sp. SD291 TaxID=2782007 RepID=UPI001A95FBB3|nr:GtrA family protein [Microbacterium sp. SD291]MBO0979393.1 GtrA family protein [Microbacterium sp. SD291]
MANTLRGAISRVWGSSAVRYLAVGGFCFLVDIALLWFTHELLGVPLPVATPVAFLASFVVTYTLQRVVAFASDNRVAPSVARYTALVIFNTLATTGIVWVVDQIGGGWILGKIAAVVATTVWNYFAYRHWVFASPHTRSSDV